MIHVDKTGPESISGAEMDNLMNAGQLAIEINGPWLNNGLKANEIDYNVTTLPQGSDSDKKQLFQMAQDMPFRQVQIIIKRSCL